MTKKWITLAVLALILGLHPAIAASSRPLSRHDLPILRNYFQSHYFETIIKWQNWAGKSYMSRVDMMRMNRTVSAWMDEYLTELSGRLSKLQAEFRAGQRFRDRALNQESDTRTRLAAQLRWRLSLTAVEDQADEIRGMLKRVLHGLKSRDKFKPEIREGSASAGFQGEMEFLGEQIGIASRRIRDYFFAPTRIVSVDALRGENMMMIYLYRVQKMSESLRKQFDAVDR